MIIGLDIFGSEEYATTKFFGIKDWIIPCPPDEGVDPWDPAKGAVECQEGWNTLEKNETIWDMAGAACDDDNVTDHFGCPPAAQPTAQEAYDAFRIWYNNSRT